MRHGFILLPHHAASLRLGSPSDDLVAIRHSLLAAEEQQRWRTGPVRRDGRADERVTQAGNVAVNVTPGRIGGPSGAGGEAGLRRCRGPAFHKVVFAVVHPRRQRLGQVRPGGDGGEAGGYGYGRLLTVPGKGRDWGFLLPAELEDGLEEGEAEVGAGAFAGEDDGGGGDGGMEGSGQRVQEGEVGYEEIEHCGGKRRLRRDAILHREAASAGELGQLGRGGAGSSWTTAAVDNKNFISGCFLVTAVKSLERAILTRTILHVRIPMSPRWKYPSLDAHIFRPRNWLRSVLPAPGNALPTLPLPRPHPLHQTSRALRPKL